MYQSIESELCQIDDVKWTYTKEEYEEIEEKNIALCYKRKEKIYSTY